MNVQIPSEVPLAHPVPHACKRIGVARTLLYQLIKEGELKAIKIAGRTLVTEAELQRFVAARVEAAQ